MCGPSTTLSPVCLLLGTQRGGPLTEVGSQSGWAADPGLASPPPRPGNPSAAEVVFGLSKSWLTPTFWLLSAPSAGAAVENVKLGFAHQVPQCPGTRLGVQRGPRCGQCERRVGPPPPGLAPACPHRACRAPAHRGPHGQSRRCARGLADASLSFAGARSRASRPSGASAWRAACGPRPRSTTCPTWRPCPRPPPATRSRGRSWTGRSPR